jgi:hypothetical protein
MDTADTGEGKTEESGVGHGVGLVRRAGATTARRCEQKPP